MCGEWAQVIQDVINEHHGTGKYGKLDTLGPWNNGQTRAGPMAPWMNLCNQGTSERCGTTDWFDSGA